MQANAKTTQDHPDWSILPTLHAILVNGLLTVTITAKCQTVRVPYLSFQIKDRQIVGVYHQLRRFQCRKMSSRPSSRNGVNSKILKQLQIWPKTQMKTNWAAINCHQPIMGTKIKRFYLKAVQNYLSTMKYAHKPIKMLWLKSRWWLKWGE